MSEGTPFVARIRGSGPKLAIDVEVSPGTHPKEVVQASIRAAAQKLGAQVTFEEPSQSAIDSARRGSQSGKLPEGGSYRAVNGTALSARTVTRDFDSFDDAPKAAGELVRTLLFPWWLTSLEKTFPTTHAQAETLVPFLTRLTQRLEGLGETLHLSRGDEMSAVFGTQVRVALQKTPVAACIDVDAVTGPEQSVLILMGGAPAERRQYIAEYLPHFEEAARQEGWPTLLLQHDPADRPALEQRGYRFDDAGAYKDLNVERPH